jgi:hypothetical protein
MTALLRAALVPTFVFIVLTSCQTPRETVARPPEVPEMSVRRAESPDGTTLFPIATALNIPAGSVSLNDTARMLAGMSANGGGDAFVNVRGSGAWIEHQSRMDGLFRDHAARHAHPVSEWAAHEIADLRSADALFYPFSGPDFLFADEFFPSAETIVLCGLEPADPLPDLGSLSGDELAGGLDGLRTALNHIMQFSYFITKDMRNDLQATRFRGVLPVILVFMARLGHEIATVDAIRLDEAGNPVLSPSNPTGLLIRARSPRGGLKRVFYFKQDLSNASFRAGSSLHRFVTQLGCPPAFTKSASYLMHEESFSNIRNFLLTDTRGIVQDPSGVPYRSLLGAGWDVRLYGNYRGTLDIFQNANQPDLIQAYQDGTATQPLDFGIGYLYQPSSTCLMVGRPR